MKNYPFYLLSIAAFGMAACNDEEPVVVDLSTPIVSNLESISQIEPYSGQAIPSDRNSILFYFNVRDPEGIEEVEVNVKPIFENQLQNQFADKFELLIANEVFNANRIDPKIKLTFESDQLNFDPMSIEWSGIYSVAEMPILAGPYDVQIAAKDVNGNKTSLLDSTSYQTTVFIDRWYAPLIHRPHGLPTVISGKAGEKLALEGGILKTDDVSSTPLKFVWIKLVDRDVLDDFKGSADQNVFEERIWGESLTFGKSGEELLSTAELTFKGLFESDPILLPVGQADLVMVVWAEDEAGNISRKTFPVEID